jgi:hypothetical protein
MYMDNGYFILNTSHSIVYAQLYSGRFVAVPVPGNIPG